MSTSFAGCAPDNDAGAKFALDRLPAFSNYVGPMLVSVADVAAAFGVDRKTVRNWEKSGAIPKAGRTPGGHLRWSADRIAEALDAQGLPVPASWIGAVAA